MSTNTCVIVGGGVVGLLAAYLSSKFYSKVYLIERSDSVGGLLGSFKRNGAIYDYGTHVPALTNIPELNQILYGSEKDMQESYHFLPYLRSENFFMGQWNLTSPLIDTRGLTESLYNKGLVELLEAKGSSMDITNLYEHLVLTFGPTFTEEIYRPVFRKLLGAELESIHRNVLRTFGLQRLLALTPEISKDLKALSRYDDSLGYHSYTDGAPPLPYCYPKGNNGIGYWSNMLFQKVKSAGVEVITERFVKKINHENSMVVSLEINDGSKIVSNHVFWTVPPVLALKAANINIESHPPKFRTHTLCHFEFEKPLLKTVPQYLLCWDSRMLSYRITLYPNITVDRRMAKRHNLTVEVLSDENAEMNLDSIGERVLSELIEMSIVSKDNTLIDSLISYMGPSFPVLSEVFLNDASKIQQEVKDKLSNITLLGRGAGSTFFINDLLIETYHAVNAMGKH